MHARAARYPARDSVEKHPAGDTLGQVHYQRAVVCVARCFVTDRQACRFPLAFSVTECGPLFFRCHLVYPDCWQCEWSSERRAGPLRSSKSVAHETHGEFVSPMGTRAVTLRCERGLYTEFSRGFAMR